VPGLNAQRSGLDPANFKAMIEEAVRTYPNFKVVATTLREVHSASSNDWGAVLWADGVFHQAQQRNALEILDRVGGGDSFASGVAYGFLAGDGPQMAVEYGAAHGALAMTTPGDTSMATKAEVLALAGGGSARVVR
jgi:2-dehydro-3-deoxygluconokinase